MFPALHKIKIALAASLCTLIASMPVYADDTEVFLGQTTTSPAAPNVLFIIDTSGSMRKIPGTKTNGTNDINNNPSKMTIVKDAFNKLINKTSGINVALMRFDSGGSGGYFLTAMQPIETGRSTLLGKVATLGPGGNTPLAETMYEAAQFYMGGTVIYGNSSSPGKDSDIASGLLDASGKKYISPITSTCQKNYTVLLTDGLPTSDDNADTDIGKLISKGTSTSTTSVPIDKSCDFSSGDDCLDELTQYMYENDMQKKSTIDGKQGVTTYTIGFDTKDAAALLNNTANAAGGKFYPANDASGLSKALTDILKNISSGQNSFMAPSVALNSFDGLTHHDQLYFAQFQPAYTSKWEGNIKSYLFYNDTSSSATCPTTLLDANGNDALEAAATCDERYKIKKTARSFWTSITDYPKGDGPDVTKGGAAGMLTDPSTRHVYTNTSAAPTTLTDAANKLNETNTNITVAMLGDSNMSATDRTNLLKWARGVDVDDSNGNGSTTDARKSMGDPLHSQPVIVTYKTYDDKQADMVLFVGTNEGYLHAINVSLDASGSNAGSGDELFAYIPQELLANLSTFKTNSSSVNHPYGLDGGITAWVNDVNGNGTIESGDSVYLYVGMRRGGRNYYALDVTDRSKPKLMWEIKGGTGDFTELGQTWSKPTLATIDVSGTKTKVLIFGGGYDINQDTATTYKTDSVGRAVYIVNANTGALLWSASPTGTDSATHLVLSDMTNSIPSDVRVVDTNMDGLDDLVYVGDTHGQLFRFDIPNGVKTVTGSATVSDKITGGMVAQLGGATATDNRRFFYPPDLVIARPAGKQPYLSINIGSGYRAHPLNSTIVDRFYALRDADNIFTVPSNYGPVKGKAIQESDLTDASNTSNTTTSDYGWYLPMTGVGEKVLAASLTLSGKVLFTAYTPPSAETSTTSCTQSSIGTGQFYALNLFDGSRVPLASDASGGSSGGTIDPPPPPPPPPPLPPGIPPGPAVVYTPAPHVCVGTMCFDTPQVISIDKTYWEQTQ